MANEITLNVRAQVVNGDFNDGFNPGTAQINQAAVGADGGIVNVGTSEEDLDLSKLTTPGLVMLKNLDDTNFVQYGPKNATLAREDFAKLLPGDVAVLRLDSSVTLRWSADTAAVNVHVKAFEA